MPEVIGEIMMIAVLVFAAANQNEWLFNLFAVLLISFNIGQINNKR